MTLKIDEIYHYNNQVAIPLTVLTKELPLSAVGMYTFLAGSAKDIAFDDEAMEDLFSVKYESTEDWKADRELLVEAGLLARPVVQAEETEEEEQARVQKLVQEINELDEQE